MGSVRVWHPSPTSLGDLCIQSMEGDVICLSVVPCVQFQGQGPGWIRVAWSVDYVIDALTKAGNTSPFITAGGALTARGDVTGSDWTTFFQSLFGSQVLLRLAGRRHGSTDGGDGAA